MSVTIPLLRRFSGSSAQALNTPQARPFAKLDQSSVNRSNKLILSIMTNSPIVTMMSNANPNQPSIMAVVPTPDLRLPFPKSCAIVLAPTDAVCCQSTETSTKTDEMKMSASATWETAREGNGLTSRSEPLSSVSWCQPGNVARSKKVIKARMMATMLEWHVSRY